MNVNLVSLPLLIRLYAAFHVWEVCAVNVALGLPDHSYLSFAIILSGGDQDTDCRSHCLTNGRRSLSSAEMRPVLVIVADVSRSCQVFQVVSIYNGHVVDLPAATFLSTVPSHRSAACL